MPDIFDRLDIFDRIADTPPPATNGFHDVLKRGGADDATFGRLTNTGITPGNAAEWAGFHIQDLKLRGIDRNEQEQVAVHNMYAQLAGDNQYSFGDKYQEQRQLHQAQEFETLSGRATAQGKKFLNLGPQAVGSAVGLISPTAGAALQERGDELFGTGQSTSSTRNLVMNTAPEALKLAGMAPAGIAGLASMYGVMGAGQSRIDIADLRAQGRSVSTLAEFRTAALLGGLEAIAGAIGGRIFQGMNKTLTGLSPTLKALYKQGDPGTIRELVKGGLKLLGGAVAEGTEEGVTQLVANGIRQGINPDQALEEGVADAVVSGMVLSPIGATTIRMNTAQPGVTVAPGMGASSDAPMSRGTIAAMAAKVDPDVKNPAGFAAHGRPVDGEVIADLTRLYFDGELASLDNGQHDFVKVSVPLDRLTLGTQYQPDVEQQYAAQPADTAPPAIGGYRDGRVVVVDGNTRARAAKLRGDTTIEMYMPVPDAATINNRVETDTGRLLEHKSQVDLVAEIKAKGERDVTAALELPSSGNTFFVTSQGRAGTFEQVAAAEAAGRAAVPTPPTRKALPAPPSHRFEAGPEGVTDLSQPFNDRRAAEFEAGRQKVSELQGQGRLAAANVEIERLRAEARTDPLTEQGNKRAWNEALDTLRERVEKRKRPGHFLWFDAANLKAANDALGHEGADAVLKDMAGKIRRVAGDTATVTRQGGDEFGVVFSPGVSAKKATQIMEKIEALVGTAEVAPGVSMFISGGLGTVRPGQPLSASLKEADVTSETRKREKKQALGEATTRSGAEHSMAQAATVAGPAASMPVDAGQTTQTSEQRQAARAAFKRRMSSTADLRSQRAGAANRTVQSVVQRLFPGAKHVARVLGKLSGRRIARAYEALVHDPSNPEVAASYAQFKEETLDQFNKLKGDGFTFDLAPVTSVTALYPNVAELSIDVGDNKHLTVNGNPGDMPANHPMMEEAPGTGGLTYNQVFRAVHDVLGHAPEGYGFTIPGEENAWRSHSSMYSDLAKGALATETRGQSSWVGYGKNGDDNLRAVEEDRIEDVVFPSQKAGLLPRDMWFPDGVAVAEDAPAPKKSYVQSLFRGRRGAAKATPIDGTAHTRRTPKVIEDFITPLASRVRDIAPAVYDRLMRMEFNTGVAREGLKRALHGPSGKITADLGGKRSERYRAFKEALLTGDRAAAEKLLSPEVKPELEKFYTVFRDLFTKLRDAGVTIGDLGPNYWPRYITDMRGFRKVFGPDIGVFDEAWALARTAQGGKPLSDEQKAQVANQVLQGFGPRKPGAMGIPNARKRTIDQVESDNSPFYMDPVESALRYVDGVTYAIERNKFLGKNARSPEEIESSVGDVLRGIVEEGSLSKDAQEELQGLLVTRFTADMMHTKKWVRNFKQLVYITTLGQFRSTLTQMTDIAFTAATHGLGPAREGLAAALRITPRERRIIMEDIGVHDHGEEFKDIGKIAKSTDWVLRKTGFKAMDRFGKEARINAATSALRRAAAEPTSSEFKRIEGEYRGVLGDSFDQTMRDMRAGKITEDVKYLVFLDIAKVQPLTTSQMPAKYLEMPNGRILYSLKTFTITQLDFVRRDMFRKLTTKGQRVDGLRNMGRYLVYYNLIGLGVDFLKDWLRGKIFTADDLPDSIMDTMLGSVGLNRYSVEKGWTNPSEAAVNFITPPLAWLDAPWQDITQAGDGSGLRSVRFIPIVGELLYFWAPFGAGFQKNRKDAEKEYKNKMSALKREAQLAHFDGDDDLVRTLTMIYNERRKEVRGIDPLTAETLNSLTA